MLDCAYFVRVGLNPVIANKMAKDGYLAAAKATFFLVQLEARTSKYYEDV